MDSIGETLREARHVKQASLEDAARATKIKLEILERLEADDFNALAAPMYTKGFLKLYAEYLGLDAPVVVDAYLKSQGGLRRQGLQVETEASLRAKGRRELQLPLAGVVRVVVALTVVIIVCYLGARWWLQRSERGDKSAAPAPRPIATEATTLPHVGVDAYYQPKNKPAPELLDPSKP
ncbi:MAG TPA: helix-turn-helix domain-containing protein [Verrucomicrobiae bacterium]|nr:helix-turn-helix domain-containing protein [Verrucomicrobiae bacterium]